MFEPELMAIWEHDSVPGYLAGKITQMESSGRVQVEGYGTRWFDPVRILPYNEAKIAHITATKTAYNEKVAKAREEAAAEIRRIFSLE